MDWASSLQDRAAQGYQPTQDETAMYTDIYQRYQSSGASQQAPSQTQQQNPVSRPQQQNQPQATNDPASQNVNVNISNNDPELQWALTLLDKVQQQGYQPNEHELSQYEQIIAKNQATQANP